MIPLSYALSSFLHLIVLFDSISTMGFKGLFCGVDFSDFAILPSSHFLLAKSTLTNA
jgi:hypothetical protein